MTPLKLIQHALHNADLDAVIENIYQNLKIAKSPRSLIVFRSKGMLPKEQVITYVQDIIDANDPYNLKNTKRRYEEFLEYLFEALNLSEIDYEVFCDVCRDMERRYDALEQPYIFVDTNFSRKGEPVIALAMLESRRRIKINKVQYLERSNSENLTYVENAIKLHYKESKGALALWGEIRAYLYYDGQGKRTVLNYFGEVIELDDVCESRATLKLGNKTLI